MMTRSRYLGDQIVGFTTSGGYGVTTGQSIALGYIATRLAGTEDMARACAAPGAKLEVELVGKRYPCTVHAKPLAATVRKAP